MKKFRVILLREGHPLESSDDIQTVDAAVMQVTDSGSLVFFGADDVDSQMS